MPHLGGAARRELRMGGKWAIAGTGGGRTYLVLDAVLVDDDPRELVSEVLAGAEHVVTSAEGGHWDTLRHLERGLVEAGAEGVGRGGGHVEDAARLGLAREAWVVGAVAGARGLKIDK